MDKLVPIVWVDYTSTSLEDCLPHIFRTETKGLACGVDRQLHMFSHEFPGE